MNHAAPSGSLWIHDQDLLGSGPSLQSHNPADGAVVFSGAAADAAQVSLAVAAAHAAQPRWERTSHSERCVILRRFADLVAVQREQLAELIIRETGKLPADAAGEINAVIAKVEITIEAQQARRAAVDQTSNAGTAEVRYRPLGPVIVLGPFNFPAHLPSGQIVPALLAGNTVVFKPSESAPAVGRWMLDRWTEAGLPPGVLNLVQGDRQVAQWLVEDARIAGVFFTGSHAAGQAIHRQLAGRPEVLLALEMGGSNPLIVTAPPQGADGDPEKAAKLIFDSAYVSSGQRCTCARRLIVVDDAYGRAVVEALVQRLDATRYGMPTEEPAPHLGPLISPAAVQQLLVVQEAWIKAGGQPLRPLEPIASPTGSWGPTLVRCGLVDVSGCSGLADDEWFGPLLQLHFVPDWKQALGSAAATRFGLAAGLLGGSREQFEQFRQEVRAGVMNWNRPLTGASSSLPFGGVGHSGNHRPAGAFTVDFCSDPVASLLNDTP